MTEPQVRAICATLLSLPLAYVWVHDSLLYLPFLIAIAVVMPNRLTPKE